jgi:predicted DNA-binding transcriptional regulator YafY
MYHPTTRALAVLALLQAHGRMTGAALAERLEVNVRTVRDYITMLQDLGAPITAERGRNGAYELDADFRLPPMTFRSDEALALAIGLLAARRLGLADTIPAAESARVKLEQMMNLGVQGSLHDLSETMMVDLAQMPADESSASIMVLLSRAIQAQQRVNLYYLSQGNNATERGLDPYGLAFYRGKWYVAGHCHLRQDLRSFRLDRITSVSATDIPFERPTTFNTLGYIIENIATLPRGFTFRVLLKTDTLNAQSEVYEVLGVLQAQDDGVLLRGSADDIDWVARQLARLPFPFVVLAPAELRAALQAHAQVLVGMA